MENEISICKVSNNNIGQVISLFDQYRVFYGQESNIEGCSEFIKGRFELKESEIWIALEEKTGQALGFVQLYPSYSSVAMKRVWVLNDLFVTPTAREKGVAKKLLEQVRIFAQETKAARVILATATDNVIAQKLYESHGYVRDEKYYHYVLSM